MKANRSSLIENEFGEIGIDGGFLKDSGVQINEMNSGCICCSLVGDFGKALEQVITEFSPDRILIEPSGVGKLSDVILAVERLHNDQIQLNGFTTVVDAKKAKMYMKNFGEFFNNQIEHARFDYSQPYPRPVAGEAGSVCRFDARFIIRTLLSSQRHGMRLPGNRSWRRWRKRILWRRS